MKWYLIDEITRSDMEKINNFLKEKAEKSEIEGLFWLKLPGDCLNKTQSLHEECQPHRFPVECGADLVKVELFSRSSKRITCKCNSYCDTRQRDWVFDFMENMIDELNIKT